ncbi:Hypothetical protein PFREUD_23550 [Propionibacterium freudenreichii subsp. shermanii CIRM-BIA1]|nr:Hypothetical protein PFREUD_23550 [Propionibacterium freudenreichii subsp. shermanii CIRM-BIA1]
MWGRSK